MKMKTKLKLEMTMKGQQNPSRTVSFDDDESTDTTQAAQAAQAAAAPVTQTAAATETVQVSGVRRRGTDSTSYNGKYVVQSFQKLLAGWDVEGVKPDGSKTERAGPYSSGVQLEMVLLPEGAPWIKAWHHEHRVFPRGKNDDQVDIGAYVTAAAAG